MRSLLFSIKFINFNNYNEEKKFKAPLVYTLAMRGRAGCCINYKDFLIVNASSWKSHIPAAPNMHAHTICWSRSQNGPEVCSHASSLVRFLLFIKEID